MTDKTVHLIDDMPMDEYQKHPAISGHDLTGILEHPERWKYEKAEPRESTTATAFGSALHTMILEPDKFESQYVREPVFSGKGSVAAKTEWREAHADRQRVKEDEWELLQRMAGKLHDHDEAMKILAGTHEQSLFWPDTETGIECKCRPDNIGKDTGWIADLKTVSSVVRSNPAAAENFSWTIYKYGYYIHAVHQINGVAAVVGVRPERFAYVVIEKEPPFAIACYHLDLYALELGQCKIRDALRRYKSRRDNDEWNSYPLGSQEIGLPGRAE